MCHESVGDNQWSSVDGIRETGQGFGVGLIQDILRDLFWKEWWASRDF